jgi:hypothetical protein
LFQLFQPIGGVAATFGDCAAAICGDMPMTNKPTAVSRSDADDACGHDFPVIFPFTTFSFI